MKKLMKILLVLLTLTGLYSPIVAENSTGFNEKYARLIDDSNILSSDDYQQMHKNIEVVRKTYNVDVAVIIIKDRSTKEIRQYAKELYEHYDFGYGQDKSGIMMLYCYEQKDMCLYVNGNSAEYAFDQDCIDYLEKDLSDYAKYQWSEDIVNRFTRFSEDFLKQASKGKPYNKDNLNKVKSKWNLDIDWNSIFTETTYAVAYSIFIDNWYYGLVFFMLVAFGAYMLVLLLNDTNFKILGYLGAIALLLVNVYMICWISSQGHLLLAIIAAGLTIYVLLMLSGKLRSKKKVITENTKKK